MLFSCWVHHRQQSPHRSQKHGLPVNSQASKPLTSRIGHVLMFSSTIMNPRTSKHVLHHACTIQISNPPATIRPCLCNYLELWWRACHDYFIPVPLTCLPGLAYISPHLRGRLIIWPHTILDFTHPGTHSIHKLLPGKVLLAQYDCRHSQVHLFLLCLALSVPKSKSLTYSQLASLCLCPLSYTHRHT